MVLGKACTTCEERGYRERAVTRCIKQGAKEVG